MEAFIGKYYIDNPKQCMNVIQWFNENKNQKSKVGTISSNNEQIVNKSYKESHDITMSLQEGYQTPCIEKFLDFLWVSINDYINKFEILKLCQFSMTENFNITKYTPPTGGFKAEHCEKMTIGDSTRLLVWMYYLNTITDEGETEFTYLDLKEKAEQGKLLIWPSGFTHTHRGIVSRTQEKYIMTGWYNLY